MIFLVCGILIPVIAVIILFTTFKQNTAWWEYCLPFFVSIVSAGMVYTIVLFASGADIEYWTNYIISVNYYEDWNEEVMSVETYTDADGNLQTRTVYEIVYHSAYYTSVDNQREERRIKKSEYKKIKSKWNNESFVDLRRDYYSNDGDMYTSAYPRNPELMVVHTSKHLYQNRISASQDSIHKFQDVDPEEWNLFDYPDESGMYVPSILSEYPISNQDMHSLNVLNAVWGAGKKIRVWFLIWEGDETLDTGYAQENYWEGGNKNELVVCIGVDQDKNVNWTHVFSWTEREDMKVQLRNLIAESDKIQIGDYVSWINDNIHMWEKRDFGEFNYLKIHIPFWGYLVVYFVSGIATAGSVAYAVSNDINQ